MTQLGNAGSSTGRTFRCAPHISKFDFLFSPSIVHSHSHSPAQRTMHILVSIVVNVQVDSVPVSNIVPRSQTTTVRPQTSLRPMCTPWCTRSKPQAIRSP